MNHRNSGRSNRRFLSRRNGRYLRSVPASSGHVQGRPVDISATLTASLLRRSGCDELPCPTLADVRFKLFQQRAKALIVFVVDASDSMGEGTLERMKAAKGAILAWLLSAYQQRDQVALVAFRDRKADILLYPTTSVLSVRRSLRQLKIGGATPLADGLEKGRQVIRTARQKHPQLRPLLVIVSDGEANVPLTSGADVVRELTDLGRSISNEHIRSLVVDSGANGRGRSVMQGLAAALGGHYQRVDDLHAGRLLALIREADSDHGTGAL